MRHTVTAISSAAANSAFLNSSKSIGSTWFVMEHLQSPGAAAAPGRGRGRVLPRSGPRGYTVVGYGGEVCGARSRAARREGMVSVNALFVAGFPRKRATVREPAPAVMQGVPTSVPATTRSSSVNAAWIPACAGMTLESSFPRKRESTRAEAAGELSGERESTIVGSRNFTLRHVPWRDPERMPREGRRGKRALR